MNSVLERDLQYFETKLRELYEALGEPVTVASLAQWTKTSEATARRRLKWLGRKVKAFPARPDGVGRPAKTYAPREP